MLVFQNKTLFGISLLLNLLFICSTYADEIDLLGNNVPVAKHNKRPSGEKFSSQKKPLVSFEYSYDLPRGAGTFDGKGNCTSSNVRRAPVLFDSEELKFFDILYYSFNDPQQQKNLSSWHLPSAPYLEGDLSNPYRENNLQQSYARFFDIRCLPTRIHFPVIDGQRYEEYREGNSAWDKITGEK